MNRCTSSALRVALLSLAALPFLLSACAPVLPQAQLVPCSRTRPQLMEELRGALVSKGFSVARYNPDSGYLRTAAKEIRTVNEISNGRPTLIVVEAQHVAEGLNVLAWRLVAIKGSVADRTGDMSENSADIEEVPLQAGERLHIFHVAPVIDHLTAYCAAQ